MDKNEYMREYFKKPENKERRRKLVYKSHAKNFIKNFATEDDMKELNRIFNER